MDTLRDDAIFIVNEAIKRVLPDTAVREALNSYDFEGDVHVVAAGKAAWQMAKTASAMLGGRVKSGIVITKYNHVKDDIAGFDCYEAGHPVPDANSFIATEAALSSVANLNEGDTVVFLLSGGGSALFESPLIPADELADITSQLLASGADIKEINTIRKRLSAVKGGKFAKLCAPAKVYSIILSDVLGDPPDMIASGPTYPDSTTCEDALEIANKYGLQLSDAACECLRIETPKDLDNIETIICGSVRDLCQAAAEACEQLGYAATVLTADLDCEARDAGSWLGALARQHAGIPANDTDGARRKLAFIAGGETVVRLTGKGRGGRNQEIALSAAREISGLANVAVFSVGSDGTDGPTDAAGGFCTGETKRQLEERGISIEDVLRENDAYSALAACGGLIITGPTGTNVNDVSVVLIG